MFTRMKETGLQDRQHAGRELAHMLEHYRTAMPVVVGIPRGGMVVGAEIARSLGCALDTLVVRRIRAPWEPTVALGAVTLNNVVLYDPYYIQLYRLTQDDLEHLAVEARADVERKTIRYRLQSSLPPVTGRTVIVVDDGLSQAWSASAAIRVLREANAKWIVVAAGVAHPNVVARLSEVADEVVCVLEPETFGAVRDWFHTYDAVSDDVVAQLLLESALHYQAVKARRKAARRGFSSPSAETGVERLLPIVRRADTGLPTAPDAEA